MITRLFILMLFCSLPLATQAANTAQDAGRFVDNAGKRVILVLDGTKGKEEKRQQLRQLFAEEVNIDWMARFVLGRGWHQATPNQRQEYMQAYRDYLLAHYTNNFADYSGSDYTITDATKAADQEYVVSMQIRSPNAKDQQTRAGYRVRYQSGQFKIIDIIIEGVSLITTQRSEFSSVLQQQGMDGLIHSIKAKTSNS